MKKTAYIGFYKKWRHGVHRHKLNGRTGHNMNDMKREEYSKLLWYVNHDEIIRYGSIPVLLRFYKNMKYRKTWIKLYKAE